MDPTDPDPLISGRSRYRPDFSKRLVVTSCAARTGHPHGRRAAVMRGSKSTASKSRPRRARRRLALKRAIRFRRILAGSTNSMSAQRNGSPTPNHYHLQKSCEGSVLCYRSHPSYVYDLHWHKPPPFRYAIMFHVGVKY
jgi:hypothetical protein